MPGGGDVFTLLGAYMIIYGRGYGNVFIKTWLTKMVTIFLFSCCVIVIVSDAKLLMTSKDVRRDSNWLREMQVGVITRLLHYSLEGTTNHDRMDEVDFCHTLLLKLLFVKVSGVCKSM